MLLIRCNKFVSKVYVRKDIPSNRICYDNLLFSFKIVDILEIIPKNERYMEEEEQFLDG